MDNEKLKLSTTTDGQPPRPGYENAGAPAPINPVTGQHEAYYVLTPEERAKGFIRPYRDAYRHLKCGKITTMSRVIAETYQRDPHYYGRTFCTTCRDHFPVGETGEFTWYEMDGSECSKVGT